MNKKELTNIFDEALIPIGFKKKGNYWIINGNKITKMVNLQKSNYGNFFYINYGYILNCIPLENEMMHVYNRLTSFDTEEKNQLTFLLNLESKISNVDRMKELKQILLTKMVPNLQAINTEEELLMELKQRPHLNNIPLTIKNYYQII